MSQHPLELGTPSFISQPRCSVEAPLCKYSDVNRSEEEPSLQLPLCLWLLPDILEPKCSCGAFPPEPGAVPGFEDGGRYIQASEGDPCPIASEEPGPQSRPTWR